MKKFIKINFLLLLSLLVISCDQKQEEEVEDTGLFFDVVYQTVSTRENPTKSWTAVQGKMQMKFTQSTAEQGTYQFYYANYKEPQFVYNTCSGGYKGNFSILTETEEPDANENYNILDPFQSGTTPGSVTSDEDPEEVSKIQTYSFNLTITGQNLDSACRSESARDILLYRFENGEVVIKSEYRELRMRPVLTSEEEI